MAIILISILMVSFTSIECGVLDRKQLSSALNKIMDHIPETDNVKQDRFPRNYMAAPDMLNQAFLNENLEGIEADTPPSVKDKEKYDWQHLRDVVSGIMILHDETQKLIIANKTLTSKLIKATNRIDELDKSNTLLSLLLEKKFIDAERKSNFIEQNLANLTQKLLNTNNELTKTIATAVNENNREQKKYITEQLKMVEANNSIFKSGLERAMQTKNKEINQIFLGLQRIRGALNVISKQQINHDKNIFQLEKQIADIKLKKNNTNKSVSNLIKTVKDNQKQRDQNLENIRNKIDELDKIVSFNKRDFETSFSALQRTFKTSVRAIHKQLNRSMKEIHKNMDRNYKMYDPFATQPPAEEGESGDQIPNTME